MDPLVHNPQNLFELQLEIGTWSRNNFGPQRSVVTNQLHGSLHPLLGIIEEVGELHDAQSIGDIHDAVGDIAVYLCDYACREWVTISRLLENVFMTTTGPDDKTLHKIVSTVGRLCRITLKRHQGIRGYDDIQKYKDERNALIVKLWGLLDRHSRLCLQMSIEKVLFDVYASIVKDRDWKERPASG